IVAAAKLLAELFAAPSRTADLVRQIKEVEHRADELTYAVNQRLDKSFITPIDREDIHVLVSRLDDVVDLIDGSARRFQMLHIADVKPKAHELARVLENAADHIHTAVTAIRNPGAVGREVTEIKRLEEEADGIYHEAVGALFSGHPDPLDVMRWKEMFDTLERTIDQCMAVAQTLQSISLKNA
ncbi:MAG TPA: DUF47 family protein, partial [Gemmatimonadaceae bacterium]|nr:DUF47 family protein [Gemmatimonadaceae bacterium]